ncbi:uncharacterized protein LOC125681258 isoform X2 [Ostrea edulis]|uniref:uncharacterized protein LOC125681258 isoform X2 n=1 Tax=Ostrea edulis TaxID=37623 RepID=UPI0024AECBCC|nr:uncharacterized protein LOC125681258 isoform X2 [Ostrea edulis]
MEQDSVSDATDDDENQKQSDDENQKQSQGDDTRKSGRRKRPPASYSPDRMDNKRKRFVKRNGNTVTGPNRNCDLLPNGEPFSCGRCGSPYVVNKRIKTSLKNSQSRHRPMPYETSDPVTGKKVWICNQCYLVFVKKKSEKNSWVKKPDPEIKDQYIKFCKVETHALANRLQEPAAHRLFCPEYTKEPCGCIQKYIKSQGDPGQADVRARELCDLLQKASELSKLKCYQLPELGSDEKPVRKNARKKIYVGLGNGHKRSRAFEAFVMEKRQYLRNIVKLCERGTQKVLMYSNNFLHKRLKTEEDNCRVVIQRSRRTMGLLTAFEEFSKNKCCVDNCVKMADTHRKLLIDWRGRAKKSQSEARRVIAEMLIPSAGCRRNCYTFINMVTGSSRGIISKVSQQMLWTGGDREPPEHGLVKFKRGQSSKGPTQSYSHPTQKPKANAPLAIKPRPEGTNIFIQPNGELVQVTGHPPIQTTSMPESKQLAAPIDPQQQQLLQLQQIFEHQQQQLIQQQLLQHTLLNEKIESSTCTPQNVITIQQLMDQMSAQVMNTQLQLQQSLQQLIAMGTHTNQSDGPMSTANQNQVILSANQQQRSVPVNCEGENTQIIPLYSMTFQPKDAADQDNIHPTEQYPAISQTQQPVYVQLNTMGGQNHIPLNQTLTPSQSGALVYSREHSSFIPYNQTSVNSGNNALTIVTNGNPTINQPENRQTISQPANGQAIISHPTHRQTISQPTNRQTISQPANGQAIISQPANRQTVSQPANGQAIISQPTHRQTVNQPTNRQTIICQPTHRQTVSQTTNRQTIICQPTHRQTISQPANRQTISQPTNRQTISQPTNRQSQMAAINQSSVPLVNRNQHSLNSAFVTVSKPLENLALSSHNMVTPASKSQPSQITIVYPGCNNFVKQCVPVSKASNPVVTETVTSVPKNVRAPGHLKCQTFSVASSARQLTGQNVGKDVSGMSSASSTLNSTKGSKSNEIPLQVVSSVNQQSLNCVSQSSDKVIQVHTISDPNMLFKLLEQTPSVETQNPTSSLSAKSALTSTTFMGDSVNTRINSVINTDQGNVVVPENPSPVIQVSNVQTNTTNGLNQSSNPPSYTYIFNPTVPPVQPLTVDVSHQIELPPAAAPSFDSNTQPIPAGTVDCVNSSCLGLATTSPQNSQLVAIDPNLLIRLCQQAFSYQALDSNKGKAKKSL